MAPIGRQRHRAAPLDQERGVAAHVPMGAHRDRDSEHGRLEHGMQPRSGVAAAHERDVGDGVQVGEDADAIDHDDGGGRSVLELGEADGARQLQVLGALGDQRQVIGVGLVRRQHEARGRHLGEQVDERGQHDRFVGGPGGARDERERAGGEDREPRERLARPVEPLGPLGDAVVAGVTGHLDRLAPGAELLEPTAVVFTDCPHAIEGAIGGLRPAARRPAQPRAVERHCRRDQPQLCPAPPRGERELGPYVELREHQRRRL